MLVHELINQGAGSDIAIVDHERRFTYDELKEAVKNCRNRLYAEGVKPGDRVAIFSRNSAEFVFVYMAVFLRLGGITEAELHSVRGGTRLLVLAKKLHLM